MDELSLREADVVLLTVAEHDELSATIALLESRAAELERELQQEIERSQCLHDNWMGVVRRLVNIIGGSK